MSMTRPAFILTKSDRKNLYGKITAEDILCHYANVYATRFSWKGFPSDVPIDYVEKQIFYMGRLGAINDGIKEVPIAQRGIYFGIHGTPLSWQAVAVQSAKIPKNFYDEKLTSERPLLNQGSVADDIYDLCQLMQRTYTTLNSCLTSMQQPIVIQGVQGGEQNIKSQLESLEKGEKFIPVLDKGIMNAEVLDLGGKDNTQNLISTINQLDCEILQRIGIKSQGTEKASGVTTEETLSISQELKLILDYDLRLRREWLELPQIREFFPNVSVELAPALKAKERIVENSESVNDESNEQ